MALPDKPLCYVCLCEATGRSWSVERNTPIWVCRPHAAQLIGMGWVRARH